jgi:hypothetical protein
MIARVCQADHTERAGSNVSKSIKLEYTLHYVTHIPIYSVSCLLHDESTLAKIRAYTSVPTGGSSCLLDGKVDWEGDTDD